MGSEKYAVSGIFSVMQVEKNPIMGKPGKQWEGSQEYQQSNLATGYSYWRENTLKILNRSYWKGICRKT